MKGRYDERFGAQRSSRSSAASARLTFPRGQPAWPTTTDTWSTGDSQLARRDEIAAAAEAASRDQYASDHSYSSAQDSSDSMAPGTGGSSSMGMNSSSYSSSSASSADSSSSLSADQSSSLKDNGIQSFSTGSGPSFISLDDERSAGGEGGSWGEESQAADLASFMAAHRAGKIPAPGDSYGRSSQYEEPQRDEVITAPLIEMVATIPPSSPPRALVTRAPRTPEDDDQSMMRDLNDPEGQDDASSAQAAQERSPVEPDQPQRATVTKAADFAAKVHSQLQQVQQAAVAAARAAQSGMPASQSAAELAALAAATSNRGPLGSSGDDDGAEAAAYLIAAATGRSMSQPQPRQQETAPQAPARPTVSLESLGPLISLKARMLEEYFCHNITGNDALIVDMQLNGQHLPVVIVNPQYGVLILELYYHGAEELMRNSQLVHQHKKHCMQLREQFARTYSERGNEFSREDMKQVTYVLQCYENLNAQEVARIFPSQSIQTSRAGGNTSSIFTRWPPSGLTQRLHGYMDQHFINVWNAKKPGDHMTTWLSGAQNVPFFLARAPRENSLFESLGLPPLDRAQREISVLLNQRRALSGQFCKFSRPMPEHVIRARNPLPGNTQGQAHGQQMAGSNRLQGQMAQQGHPGQGQQRAAQGRTGLGQGPLPGQQGRQIMPQAQGQHLQGMQGQQAQQGQQQARRPQGQSGQPMQQGSRPGRMINTQPVPQPSQGNMGQRPQGQPNQGQGQGMRPGSGTGGRPGQSGSSQGSGNRGNVSRSQQLLNAAGMGQRAPTIGARSPAQGQGTGQQQPQQVQRAQGGQGSQGGQARPGKSQNPNQANAQGGNAQARPQGQGQSQARPGGQSGSAQQQRRPQQGNRR